MDVGTYTVHMARLLGREEPEVVSATAKLRTPDVDRAMPRRAALPERHTGRITCSMWSSWVLQTYARVTGDHGELHVINPTAPQLWHRMRVKVDGAPAPSTSPDGRPTSSSSKRSARRCCEASRRSLPRRTRSRTCE